MTFHLRVTCTCIVVSVSVCVCVCVFTSTSIDTVNETVQLQDSTAVSMWVDWQAFIITSVIYSYDIRELLIFMNIHSQPAESSCWWNTVTDRQTDRQTDWLHYVCITHTVDASITVATVALWSRRNLTRVASQQCLDEQPSCAGFQRWPTSTRDKECTSAFDWPCPAPSRNSRTCSVYNTGNQ